ncbi:MAG TPA: Uma2 family endonuclease [Tepidisphaeraceae bacterium]|nr:Uma2 family endonuclease [Tepidisphaeraceae bacterium]
MVISTTKMTAKQYLMLGEDPPGVRLELVNGEIAVSPSLTPSHSYAIIELITLLNVHIRAGGIGELYQDVDTILDKFNVRRPDVLFFARGRLHLIGKKAMEGPPDLAVEVISPSSVEVDREDKFEQYRAARVAHYWIVDPAMQTVEGFRLTNGRYELVGRAQGGGTLRLPPFPDLEIPLSRLWRKEWPAP